MSSNYITGYNYNEVKQNINYICWSITSFLQLQTGCQLPLFINYDCFYQSSQITVVEVTASCFLHQRALPQFQKHVTSFAQSRRHFLEFFWGQNFWYTFFGTTPENGENFNRPSRLKLSAPQISCDPFCRRPFPFSERSPHFPKGLTFYDNRRLQVPALK